MKNDLLDLAAAEAFYRRDWFGQMITRLKACHVLAENWLDGEAPWVPDDADLNTDDYGAALHKALALAPEAPRE